jgi:hypothetical protein
MADSDAHVSDSESPPLRVALESADVIGQSREPAYVRRPGVVSSELDGKISLFDGSSTALVLNTTATAIWHELSEPTTVTELATRLAGRFTGPQGPLDPGTIAGQVEDLLLDLLGRGVVTTAS